LKRSAASVNQRTGKGTMNPPTSRTSIRHDDTEIPGAVSCSTCIDAATRPGPLSPCWPCITTWSQSSRLPNWRAKDQDLAESCFSELDADRTRHDMERDSQHRKRIG
jgi:hypothetical protein